jgi:hypothetical protein
MRLAVAGILILVSFCSVRAQEPPRDEIDFARITEEVVGFQDADIAYDEILENYIHLFSSPLDVNQASVEELTALNLLTDVQINNLAHHLKENGPLLSIYELQSIEGFDVTSLHRLSPFLVVDKNQPANPALKRLLSQGDGFIVTRWERSMKNSSGYSETDSVKRFAGSPDKLYLRLRKSQHEDFSVGFTLEKDAGEPLAWMPGRNYYGADYISFHLQLKNRKRIENLIAGDYRLQFGQGLILGNSFGLGKGGETITTVRRANSGFVPYTSVSEGGYLRGVATRIRVSTAIHLSLFYSNTLRDATVRNQNEDEPTFSSFISSGYHRNEKELAIRKKVREQKSGLVLEYTKKDLSLGVITEMTNYNVELSRTPTPYNQFAFEGDTLTNASGYFNYRRENVNLFGEVAKSLGGGRGIVAGTLVSVSREFDVSFLYRNYARNFYGISGNAFSENTTAQNEEGFYWGLKYRFNRKYTVSAYLDLFRFPWLKFRNYSPSDGSEYLVRFAYTPTRKTNVSIQYREELKDRNVSYDQPLFKTAPTVKRNLSANFDAEVMRNVKLRTRVQYSQFEFDGSFSEGFAFSQDISFALNKFKISLRHSLFDTDDYENRQYVYEKDVWLAYSLPAYNGKGIRNVVMVDFKASRLVSISARYSRSAFNGVQEIISGSETIHGNSQKHIKLQMKISF